MSAHRSIANILTSPLAEVLKSAADVFDALSEEEFSDGDEEEEYGSGDDLDAAFESVTE